MNTRAAPSRRDDQQRASKAATTSPAKTAAKVASPPTAVDWRRDIEILRDLSVTVRRSHLAATEAFWDKIAEAPKTKNPPVEQKILTARLAAEAISATEDLGALLWAIANRAERGGVGRAYLMYKPKYLWTLFERPRDGEPTHQVLRLPAPERVSRKNRGTYRKVLKNLGEVLPVAARNYLSENRALVGTYNKIKHGFVVVARMDRLIRGKEPETDWKNDVNVLSDIDERGNIRFTAIERTAEHMKGLVAAIKMCGDCWGELTALLIWMRERGVSLDVPPPPD